MSTRWQTIQRFSARPTSTPLTTASSSTFLPTFITSLSPTATTIAIATFLLILPKFLRLFRTSRTKVISPTSERVIIIGGSSGIGREVALEYVKRGARVFITGRGEEEVVKVVEELDRVIENSEVKGARRVIGMRADFTQAEEMVAVREEVKNEWAGLDTLIVSAGVSALQPILTLAGVDPRSSTMTSDENSLPTIEGVQQASKIATAAMNGNFLGPFVTAVTLIPLLTATSPSPTIHLISSLASTIPAPTRALYGSTKTAALQLYRSLSIEHPQVAFTYTLPSTVKGGFRKGAVDAHLGPLHEDDPNVTDAGKARGLAPGYVAKRIVESVDGSAKGGWATGWGSEVYVPGWYWYVQFVWKVFPGFIEKRAASKYNFGTVS